MSNISFNRNLKAVLNYEKKLIKENSKISIDKKKGMVIKKDNNLPYFEKMLPILILEHLKVPVFSINTLFEENKANMVSLPMLSFNEKGIKGLKEYLNDEIRIINDLIEHRIKNKENAVEFKKEYIRYSEFLVKINKVNTMKSTLLHEYLTEDPKNNKNILLMIKSHPEHWNISITTKNKDFCFSIDKIGCEDFELGFAIGTIKRVLF